MRIELSLMVFIAAAAAAADLSIYPPAITLWGQKATQVVAVTRLDVDGVHRDVTAECHLSVDDATVASVSKGGVILAVGNGTTTLHAVHKDLTAQIKVTTSSTGARPKVSFVKDVLPLFTMSGCANANCHGSIRGQRGFKLSLFGYDPPFDFEAITGGDGHRIDRRNPAKSLILQKPTFQVPHGGGVRFAAGSLPYQTILEWLQDGARFDASDSPRIQALSIFPEERILVGMGTTQQLIATARYTDGSSRDVTRLVQYSSNAPDFVQVGPTGIVKAIQPGETAVMIRTLGQSVAARILVASQPVSRDYPEIPRNNYVDNLVFAKLRRLNITPSPLADDITFLRRAYVDTIGLLPTEEETDRFLVSQDPNRRAKLIDELLQRPELADLWALKFTELFRAGTRESDTKGSRIIYEYLQRSFAANKPYDDLVRELLLSQGPHYFSDGPSSFYNISFDSNPADNVTNVSQLFLGVRMECARCHNHPFEKWTQDDFYGFAAFFARVGVKELYENNENATFLKEEGSVIHPRTKEVVKPKYLAGDFEQEEPDEDIREKLARWVTSTANPFFARAIVNRVWKHFMARGLVEAVDDFRVTNPPSHPDLLDALAQDLTSHRFDLRHLMRVILNSRTYQLSAEPNESNRNDLMNYSHYALRRMSVETMVDAITQVAGVPEKFQGYPVGTRAMQVDQTYAFAPNYVFKTFGRPARDIICERDHQPDIAQTLHLIIGETISKKISSSKSSLEKWLQDPSLSDEQILHKIFRRALVREPSDSEKQQALSGIGSDLDNRRKVFQDVLWAVLNSKEFHYNH